MGKILGKAEKGMNINNIVLVQCPCLTAVHPPSIGLAYIAGVLRKAGYNVKVVDLNIEFYSQVDAKDRETLRHSDHNLMVDLEKASIGKYSSLLDKFIKDIIDLDPDVVGFSVWETNDSISLYFAKKLKEIKGSLYVMFGGPSCDPLFSNKKYIENEFVDMVVCGEAENTVVEALSSLREFGRLIPLQGTMIKKDNLIYDLGSGNRVENLDELPLPAIDIFPMDAYINKEIPISFNRGCVFRCEYCETAKMRPGFRSRGAQNIIEEILYRLKAFPGKNNFFVCDSTVTANLKQISELCDLIDRRGLGISFTGYATPHRYMDTVFMSKMKKAGFNFLIFGVESGSNAMLEKFGKKLKIDFIENVIRETHNAGIKVGVNILVGLPGEENHDFDDSLGFLTRNREYIDSVGVNCFGIMPHSYIFYHPEEFNFVPEEIKSGRLKCLRETIDNLGLSYTVKDRPN